MDLEVIIAEVAKRHRFVLSPDDPVLATVTLTELVWQEAARDLENRLNEALDEAGRAWAEELRSSTACLQGMAQGTEDSLTAALGRVRIACEDMARETAASLQTRLAQDMAQSRKDWSATLEESVAAIRQATQDAVRARRWAVASAALSAAIALGIVGVLTAPVWMALLRAGH